MTGEPAEPRDELRLLLRWIEELPTDEHAPPQVALRAGRVAIDEPSGPAHGLPVERPAGPKPATRRTRAARLLVGAAAGAVLGVAWSLAFEWPQLWHGKNRTDEIAAERTPAPARPDDSTLAPAGTGAVPPIPAGPVPEVGAQAAQAHGASAARTSPERIATAGGGAPADNATGARSANPPARGDGGRPDDANRDRLLIKGLRTLVLGNVSSARLLLRRAAEAGDGRAALVLGDTFDDVRLVQLGVLGVQPDRAKAVYWYERADALGAPEAKERLSDLNAR
jgi:hypothetical protein